MIVRVKSVMLGHHVKATMLTPPFLSSSTQACGMCSEPQQQTHTAAHHMEILHIARSVDSMPCVPWRRSSLRLGTFSSLSATARPPSAPRSLPAHITHCCSSSASSSTAGQSNQNRSRYDRVTPNPLHPRNQPSNMDPKQSWQESKQVLLSLLSRPCPCSMPIHPFCFQS